MQLKFFESKVRNGGKQDTNITTVSGVEGTTLD